MASRINWAPLQAQQALRAQQLQDAAYGFGQLTGENWGGIKDNLTEKKKKIGGLFSGLADRTTTGDVDGLDSDALVTTDLRGTKLDNFVSDKLDKAKNFLFPEGGAKYRDQEGLFRGGKKFNEKGELVDDNRLFGRFEDLMHTTGDLVKHGPGFVMDELENKAKDIAGMPGKYIKGIKDQRDQAALDDIQADIDSWGDDIPDVELDSTGRPIVPLDMQSDGSEIDIEPIPRERKGLMDFLFPKGGQMYKDMFSGPGKVQRNKIYKNGEVVNASDMQGRIDADFDAEYNEMLNMVKNNPNAFDFSDHGSGTSENSALIEAANNSPFQGDIDAIKQFQEEMGLEVDGFWGPNTQAAWENSQNQDAAFNSNYIDSSTEESLWNDYYNQEQWNEDNAPPGSFGFY